MRDLIIIIIIISVIRFMWNNFWYKMGINHMEGKDWYAKRKRNGTWIYYDKRTGKKTGYSNSETDYIESYYDEE